METNINVRTVITETNEPNKWNVAFARINDEKLYPLFNLIKLSASEIYVKTGIKMETEYIPDETRLEDAKSLLRERLAGLGSRTIVSMVEVQDVLLDALNALGYKDDDKDV